MFNQNFSYVFFQIVNFFWIFLKNIENFILQFFKKSAIKKMIDGILKVFSLTSTWLAMGI